MKHIEWLKPDNIILSDNGTDSKEFTRDMRSRNYSRLRLLEYSSRMEYSKIKYTHIIRYVIEDKAKNYSVCIINKRGSDYYISISKITTGECESDYVFFNREDNLNKLLR